MCSVSKLKIFSSSCLIINILHLQLKGYHHIWWKQIYQICLECGTINLKNRRRAAPVVFKLLLYYNK